MSGVQQQIRDRRRQTVARHEHRLGADELDLLGRNVEREVDGPRRQRELRDVGKSARIGVGSLQAHQLERRIVQRLPDRRELHLADEERGVDLAALQGMQRPEIDQPAQPGVGRGDAVGGEQRLDEGSDSAARRADRDLHAAKLVELRQRRRAAVEDPERLVVQRHEHGEVAALLRRDDPAVHEGHVDAGIRLVQQLLVVLCAARHSNLDGHALSGQDVPVALRVLVVQAVLKAGGEDDAMRDRADQEPGARQSQDRKQRSGHPRPFQGLPTELADLLVATHGLFVSSVPTGAAEVCFPASRSITAEVEKHPRLDRRTVHRRLAWHGGTFSDPLLTFTELNRMP